MRCSWTYWRTSRCTTVSFSSRDHERLHHTYWHITPTWSCKSAVTVLKLRSIEDMNMLIPFTGSFKWNTTQETTKLKNIYPVRREAGQSEPNQSNLEPHLKVGALANLHRNGAVQRTIRKRKRIESCQVGNACGHESCDIQRGEVQNCDAWLALPFTTPHTPPATGIIACGSVLQPCWIEVTAILPPGPENC